MACSKLEARGHLRHKTGTPPKHFSRECMSCCVGVGTYLARVEFGTERGFKPREDLESKFSNNILENLEPFFTQIIIN